METILSSECIVTNGCLFPSPDSKIFIRATFPTFLSSSDKSKNIQWSLRSNRCGETPRDSGDAPFFGRDATSSRLLVMQPRIYAYRSRRAMSRGRSFIFKRYNEYVSSAQKESPEYFINPRSKQMIDTPKSNHDTAELAFISLFVLAIN